ncbi:MAG: hypothetical protein ACE145_15890 [Terriglobia bacterium]
MTAWELRVLFALHLILTVPIALAGQQPRAVGSASSDSTEAKYPNTLRFADQFPGPTGTAKQDAAIAGIGSAPGLVLVPPGVGPGNATTYPNQVGVIDLRQTADIIGNLKQDPDRTPLMLLENRLGELTTRPLTGTVTLTKGSTAVVGNGTRFEAELSGHFGRSIKLDSDDSTCWAEIGSVANNTTATLKSSYPCASGTGRASYFITQLGFAVNLMATAGTPNTPNGGEGVGFTVVAKRPSGARGVYGANINTSYNTAPTTAQGQAMGLEVDLSNFSSADQDVPGTGANFSTALHLLSAGSKRPGYGLSILSTTGRANTNSFQWGIWVGNYSQHGLHINGASNHVYLVPYLNNSDPMLVGRNAGDKATVWRINNDGSAHLSGPLSLATDSPNPTALLHAYVSANALKVPVRLENDNGGTGTVALGLGVASSRSETRSAKAGVGMTRSASNGRGDVCLFNRLTDDALDFATSDWFICNRGGEHAGRTEIQAQGKNEDIVLTPSGTGKVATSKQIQTTVVTGTPPFSVSSTTPVANLTTVPLTYNAAGSQQVGVHMVYGNCTIGRDCGVTLVGPAAFSGSGTYRCTASDNTAPNPISVTQSSGSAFAITGTASDSVSYICLGN